MKSYRATRRLGWGASGLALFVLACGAVAVAKSPEAPPQERPAIVVLVVVDQLRADLLDRYDAFFTGGLRRLRDGGFRFVHGNHAHALTETGPGHATLGTGVFPSRSGIVANSWSERVGSQWRSVYAVEDSMSPITGNPSAPGRSPANLMVGGLADWIAASDPESQVVSVSRKDRAAIGLAARARGHVYWLDGPAFVTSTYYREAVPEWVEAVNRELLASLPLDSLWVPSWPEGAQAEARYDTASFEHDGVHTYFPHSFGTELAGSATEEPIDSMVALASFVALTPAPDRATFRLAEAAIDALELGADAAIDFLAVAPSQTDYIGHSFGPLSREQLDNLVHLDRELGRFLEFLDDRVGEGRWVLALSSDHGVLTMPEYLRELGEPARRVGATEFADLRQRVNEAATAGGSADPQTRIAEAVAGLDWVADAFATRSLTDSGSQPDSFRTLYARSYVPGREPGPLSQVGVTMRLEPLHLLGGSRGTSHGSPYWYDRHVPILFYGPGIEAGASEAAAETVDVAPTLARLAGVRVPEGLDGTPLPLPGR